MRDTKPSGRPAPRVSPARDGVLWSEILVVGGDLLSGRVGDSSAQLVAAALADRCVPARRITVVPDDVDSIAATLREALERNPHVVVTIGGLGPAVDDRTLEGVSEVLGRPLALSSVARERVEAAYRRLREERRVEHAGLDAAREKLARLPIGCTVLDNPTGVSPGALCRLPGGAAVISVPGTPREARAVFESALPHLTELGRGRTVARREVEAPLPDESALRPLIEQLAGEFPHARVSTRPVGSPKKGYRLVVLIETGGEDAQAAESAIGVIVKRLLALVSGAR